MGEIIITSDNFENEVLKSDKPVLVDFWAPWCGPCKMMGPIVSDVAEKLNGQIKVGKCNTDEQTNLALSFGIDAIPCFILFKNGKIAKKEVGYMSEEDLISLCK